MNDCPNAEIRDQLPELLHDRLDSSARAAVSAHVASCVDCREELELLRGIHGTLVACTPRIDVASIVAALPKGPAREVRTVRPRRTWADWRIAAAVTLLVAGGGSVAVYQRVGVQASPMITPAVAAESIGRTATPNAVVRAVNPGVVTPSHVVPAETVAMISGDEGADAGPAVSSAAADLNDRQLQALLDDINRLEAVPITDPDPVSIRVTPKTTAPSVSPGRGSE